MEGADTWSVDLYEESTFFLSRPAWVSRKNWQKTTNFEKRRKSIFYFKNFSSFVLFFSLFQRAFRFALIVCAVLQIDQFGYFLRTNHGRRHHPFTSQKVRKICLLLGESLLKPSSGDPHRYIFKHEVTYLVRPVTDIPDNYPFQRGAAIAQWIHLHLPSCCPGFESPAYHLHFCNL